MTFLEARVKLRDLAALARAAAKRRDWKVNYKLCRQHDDLAVQHGVPSRAWSDPEGF